VSAVAVSKKPKRKVFYTKNGCLLVKGMIIDLSKVRYIDASADDVEEDGKAFIMFDLGENSQVEITWKYNRHFYELEIDELFEEFVAARRRDT
jgi:hypothetical protein